MASRAKTPTMHKIPACSFWAIGNSCETLRQLFFLAFLSFSPAGTKDPRGMAEEYTIATKEKKNAQNCTLLAGPGDLAQASQEL